MKIAKDTVVQLHYTLKDSEGNLIETTRQEGEPIAYLQGHHNMIEGFEAAVEGKEAGDHVDITITPENGYGHRIEGSVQRVPVKHLLGHNAKVLAGSIRQFGRGRFHGLHLASENERALQQATT
ncbi:MAG: FKBP-type peptidyl-prolyl cis-trans isomerase, partial [Thalassolituus sp.]